MPKTTTKKSTAFEISCVVRDKGYVPSKQIKIRKLKVDEKKIRGI